MTRIAVALLNKQAVTEEKTDGQDHGPIANQAGRNARVRQHHDRQDDHENVRTRRDLGREDFALKAGLGNVDAGAVERRDRCHLAEHLRHLVDERQDDAGEGALAHLVLVAERCRAALRLLARLQALEALADAGRFGLGMERVTHQHDEPEEADTEKNEGIHAQTSMSQIL
jgi:hypothetical protein